MVNNRVTARIPPRRVRASDHLSKRGGEGPRGGPSLRDARRRDIGASLPVTWTCVGLHIVRFPGLPSAAAAARTAESRRSPTRCRLPLHSLNPRDDRYDDTLATHGAPRNVRITRSCLAHWPTASLARLGPHSESHRVTSNRIDGTTFTACLTRFATTVTRRASAPSNNRYVRVRRRRAAPRRAIDAPGADRTGSICAATFTAPRHAAPSLGRPRVKMFLFITATLYFLHLK